MDENIFLREGKCKSSLEKISFLECKVFWRKKKVGRARFLTPEKITPIECRRRESNVDENIFLREIPFLQKISLHSAFHRGKDFFLKRGNLQKL